MKNIITNRIIDRTDVNNVMKALQFRFDTLNQSIYDIHLVIYELTNNECVIVSSYINNVIVASAYIKTLTLDSGEEALLLDNLFVRNELRHKGIGTQLMYYVLGSKDEFNKIFNKDCQRIVVNSIYKDNKEMYSRAGFEDIDETFMGRKL